MADFDVSAAGSWHAHVYFDSSSRDAAWAFREAIATRFDTAIEMGRFHERPGGPHPLWSYQVAFTPAHFLEIVTWLTLNSGAVQKSW